MPNKEEKIRVLAVRPGEYARIEILENTLEAMQAFVGGYIEAVPWDERTVLVCNEDGKNLDLTPNRWVTFGEAVTDLIVGNFLFCGVDGEEFCSISNAVLWLLKEQMNDGAEYADEMKPSRREGVQA